MEILLFKWECKGMAYAQRFWADLLAVDNELYLRWFFNMAFSTQFFIPLAVFAREVVIKIILRQRNYCKRITYQFVTYNLFGFSFNFKANL
jgi:hypothetical protein